MVKKKTSSFAEQLAELSNPAPSLDPEDTLDPDAGAKVVEFDEDSSDEVSRPQQPSRLRKLTSVPLSQGDKRYAGKSSSRDNWLADSDSEDDGHDATGDTSSEDDDDEDVDEPVSKSKIANSSKPNKKVADKLMQHFEKISAQFEEESESDSDEESEEENDRVKYQDKVAQKTKVTQRSKHIDMDDKDDDDDDEVDDNDDNEDDEDDDDDDDDEFESEEDKEEAEQAVESESDEEEELDDEDDTGFSEDEDSSVKPFSQQSLQEELKRGLATKAQLGLWDGLLEARIKLQKALSLTNQIPQPDAMEDFVENGGMEVEEALRKGKDDLQKLVSSMIELQEALLLQNPETRHVVDGSKPSASKKSEDEEISSDDEEIPSDDEDISSEDEMQLTKIKKHSVRVQPSQGRKRPLEESEYGEHLAKRHKGFEQYRNGAIQKWHDRTKLSTGKINSKSFSSFDKSPLAQIQQVLQDKDRLIKRTQLKRTTYKILGKPETIKDDEDSNDQDQPTNHNAHLKDYDGEIFDDDDFYHQLLRELIEKKTADASDPLQLTRQWLEVQKLRSKVKKRVDTKASKGRKLRYNVHQKLLSFMAPMDTCSMTEDARDELYGSLFGQRKTNKVAVDGDL